jgi:hypothetical protein
MLVQEPPVDREAALTPQAEGPRPPHPGSWRTRAVFVVAIVMAFVAGVVAFVVIDDDSKPAAVSPTSTAPAATTAPPTTAAVTTAPPATTPATTATTKAPATVTTAPPVTVPVDTSTAVWPTASGPVYKTPVAAARGFAVDFVGFRSPIVGAFKQGDSRSGEVDIRAKADGAVTTVFVRQLGAGGRWFVLGSVSGNILLTEPAALQKVSSPLRLKGTSTAFEANVSVQVRQDGTKAPIGTGFVMGGSMGEMGPFDGTVTFRRPTAKHGAILLLTYSMEDGRVWEASTVRVAF